MGLGSFFKKNKSESSEESHIIIDSECDGCEKCVTACPNNVLICKQDKAFVQNAFGCKHCRVCEAICPIDAIHVGD